MLKTNEIIRYNAALCVACRDVKQDSINHGADLAMAPETLLMYRPTRKSKKY